jgi:hypothetical protein
LVSWGSSFWAYRFERQFFFSREKGYCYEPLKKNTFLFALPARSDTKKQKTPQIIRKKEKKFLQNFRPFLHVDQDPATHNNVDLQPCFKQTQD